MNDGVLTLITQWCLLCLVWMGLFDAALRRIRVRRAEALAVLTLFLVCSYASWQLYFLPVSVNVSGAILPVLAGAWIWSVLPPGQKRYCLLCTLFSVFLLFAARKLFFWDPVLLILDESLLLPPLLVSTLFLLVRQWKQQLAIVLFSLPLSDGLYMVSSLRQLEVCIIGGDYAQDLLWGVMIVWLMAAVVWGALAKGIGFFRAHLLSHLKWKNK